MEISTRPTLIAGEVVESATVLAIITVTAIGNVENGGSSGRAFRAPHIPKGTVASKLTPVMPLLKYSWTLLRGKVQACNRRSGKDHFDCIREWCICILPIARILANI